MIAIPITQTTNRDALSNHICIDTVSHELADKASNIGFILFESALKIVNTTNDLTTLVAISPMTPDKGRIRVHIYNAIVIGINPKGLLRAFKISSSTLESVLSASFPKALRMTEIIKPLNKNAIKTTPKDVIIEPRSIPKKPRFQTSFTKLRKFSIRSYILC